MSALDDPPPDFDRHRDALVITESGAGNPSGIALTLQHACGTCRPRAAGNRTTPQSGSSGAQLPSEHRWNHRPGGLRPPAHGLPYSAPRAPEHRARLVPRIRAAHRTKARQPPPGAGPAKRRGSSHPRRPAGGSTHCPFGERHARRPPGAGCVTAALLAEHKQHSERERTVTGLIRRMQSHWRRRPELGRASPDSQAVESPQHRPWRSDASETLDTARAWLGEKSDTARHLNAMPGARAGLETAVRDVERVRARSDFFVFERRWHAARAQAARDGIPAIDVAGYAEVAMLDQVPVVLTGPIEGSEDTLADKRIMDQVPRAVAEWFNPCPDFFVELTDYSMRGAGLVAGDLIAATRPEVLKLQEKS